MRILHLTPYYKPGYAFGGVVRSVEGMATSLVARGHEVTILTTDALDQQRRYAGAIDETIDGVHVLRRANVLPGLRGRFNLSTPRSMKQTTEAILPCAPEARHLTFERVESIGGQIEIRDLGSHVEVGEDGRDPLLASGVDLAEVPTFVCPPEPRVADTLDHHITSVPRIGTSINSTL